MQTRYDVMKDFDVPNKNGIIYKDIFSFPLKDREFFFRKEKDRIFDKLTITQREKLRLDLAMFELFDVPEFDDLFLWFFDVACVSELDYADLIDIPTIEMFLDFFEKNSTLEEEKD